MGGTWKKSMGGNGSRVQANGIVLCRSIDVYWMTRIVNITSFMNDTLSHPFGGLHSTCNVLRIYYRECNVRAGNVDIPVE